MRVLPVVLDPRLREGCSHHSQIPLLHICAVIDLPHAQLDGRSYGVVLDPGAAVQDQRHARALVQHFEPREIERVGGGKPIRVDVRIVSATNKDLIRASGEGAFRDDLLFRLNVIPIPIPPLRERPTDIPALVRHFSALHRMRTGQAMPSWTEEAVAALTRYTWPGNIRELANIVERLAILHAGRTVTHNDIAAVLPLERAARLTPPTPLPDPALLDHSLSDTLDDYERVLITRALSVAGGNIAEAARRLQTDRPNLYRRMKRLGIVESDRERGERIESRT